MTEIRNKVGLRTQRDQENLVSTQISDSPYVLKVSTLGSVQGQSPSKSHRKNNLPNFYVDTTLKEFPESRGARDRIESGLFSSNDVSEASMPNGNTKLGKISQSSRHLRQQIASQENIKRAYIGNQASSQNSLFKPNSRSLSSRNVGHASQISSDLLTD